MGVVVGGGGACNAHPPGHCRATFVHIIQTSRNYISFSCRGTHSNFISLLGSEEHDGNSRIQVWFNIAGSSRHSYGLRVAMRGGGGGGASNGVLPLMVPKCKRFINTADMAEIHVMWSQRISTTAQVMLLVIVKGHILYKVTFPVLTFWL